MDGTGLSKHYFPRHYVFLHLWISKWLRSRLLRRENNATQNQLASTAEFKDTACQTYCIYIGRNIAHHARLPSLMSVQERKKQRSTRQDAWTF